MDLVASSTPYLPSHGGLLWELLLLQFLNQLRTHHNTTTQHTVQAVQQCVESLKQEERRRKQLISQHDDDYSKLSADYLYLQEIHLSTGKHIENLEESLKESFKNCDAKIGALERQVEKENFTRMVCERDAKLQKAYSDLEKLNKELHEMRNCSLSHDGKINQVFTTLQLISENLNIGKDILLLENQLTLTEETLKNSTEMNKNLSRELENERQETQRLEQQNTQLDSSLHKLQKFQQEQNQKYEAQLQAKTEELRKIHEELKKKEDVLQGKEEELKKKAKELKEKDNELIDERRKNAELQKMAVEIHKKQRDCEMQNSKLLEAERSNCSTQLQEHKAASESKMKIVERKTQEAQNQLESCNEHLDTHKAQAVVVNKNVYKVIEFTNQYRKYLASGNFNFAIAFYGDTQIKDIFRPSESIFGGQMTEQEAHKDGFSCGNGRYIPKCFKCDGTDDCGNRNDESNCSTSVFPLGARVARGPAWKWENQDGDPPGVGTVIYEQYPDQEGWNAVKWDKGGSYTYRIGGEGKMDLRAAAGYFCGAT